MPAGKAASQAGHAFLGAFEAADGLRRYQYHQDGIGTKICLGVPDLASLEALKAKCVELELPHFLVEDSGRNTTFGGVTTISALGIGPLRPGETEFLRHLKLF